MSISLWCGWGGGRRSDAESVWAWVSHDVVCGEELAVWASGSDFHLVPGVGVEPKRGAPAIDQLAIADGAVIGRENSTPMTLATG